MLTKAGFINFKKEYTNCLVSAFNKNEFLEKLNCPPLTRAFEKLSKEQQNMFNNEMDKITTEFKNSEKFINLNVLVFSVFK